LGLRRGVPRDDLISSSRFHRIIRRGRPYRAVTDHHNGSNGKHSGSKAGLYFIALNANISRQFEFVQNAWIVNSKFNGLDVNAAHCSVTASPLL
jgi:deferrochelatase/peroxidase EfeB